MDDEEKFWVGLGDSPREAVRDLAPSRDHRDVAWVEGIEAITDDQPSEKESIKADITIIYESRPAKQRKVMVSYESAKWRASFLGGKNLSR